MDNPTTPPPIPKPVSIIYNLSKFDVFSNYFTILLRNRIIMMFVAAMLVFNLFLVFKDPWVADKPWPFVILYALIRSVIFLLILLFVQAVLGALTVFSQRDRGLIGQHVLEITDEGLVESTDVNRGLHKWAGIHKIKSGGAYLYIYTGATRFFQVPRQGIQSGHLETFEAELRRRVADAKGTAASDRV